jgi:hypothetical protein
MSRAYGVMRDLMDGQLRGADGVDIGRVADIEAEWGADGQLVLRRLWCGPEALARRVSSRLGRLVASLTRGRFDHSIPIEEVASIDSLVIKLRRPSSHYQVGRSERRLADLFSRLLPSARR